MYNNFYQPSPVLINPKTRERLQASIGSVHRTNKVQRINSERENIEQLFLAQSERALRAESQRNDRISKRFKK